LIIEAALEPVWLYGKLHTLLPTFDNYMANTQVLTSKFLSLNGQRWIHGLHGRLLFEASRPRIFGRIIELKNPLGLVVATINPQPWKPRPTWEISMNSGSYAIKRQVKSFGRLYHIEAGMFDGAVIEDGDFDRQFRIQHHDRILAQASEVAFSLIAKNVIDVMEDDEQVNLLAAVVSVIISTEKQRAGAERTQ
jgi:hypothetical protein